MMQKYPVVVQLLLLLLVGFYTSIFSMTVIVTNAFQMQHYQQYHHHLSSISRNIVIIPFFNNENYNHHHYQGISSSSSSSSLLLFLSSTADSDTTSSTNSINTSTESPIDFVRNLLHQLSSSSSSTTTSTDDNDDDITSYEKGLLLLNASSDSWKNAIYQAIGMTTSSSSSSESTIDTKLIAKSLQKKMSNPNNQFAILLSNNQNEYPNYTITFPSDIVDYQQNDDNTVWIECQLRNSSTNELYVIMGIHLILLQQQNDNDESLQWKIISLNWQDFREEFYPGLSGREWLRSF